LTAQDGNSGDVVPMRGVTVHEEGDTVEHVDRTCLMAVHGRRAARVVAEWAKRFGLSEPEFQLLWRLRSAPVDGCNQTALAASLAFSPAQISASVERLRALGYLCLSQSSTDRRRRQWQLSSAGRERLDQVLLAAALQRSQPDCASASDMIGGGCREAAA
jgi:DNA-binding MarR family transcriptional regulator